MIKHRDWTIEKSEYWFGYEAVHDNYEAEHDGAGTWTASIATIHGNTVQDCIEQIDDWYEENEDD